MKAKTEPMVLRGYVSELLEVTKVTARKVADKNHETVDCADIIQYAISANEIHETLLKSYDLAEGRPKAIDRFISQWNNLVFGIFYSSDIAIKKKTLSERQYDIFTNTIEEITVYGEVSLAAKAVQ